MNSQIHFCEKRIPEGKLLFKLALPMIFSVLVSSLYNIVDSIFVGIADLYAAISHRLTNRIIELAERYESTLPELAADTAEYEVKVKSHLERMGFKW